MATLPSGLPELLQDMIGQLQTTELRGSGEVECVDDLVQLSIRLNVSHAIRVRDALALQKLAVSGQQNPWP